MHVRLITEIKNENVSACKKLMVNHGVQLRHLEGVSQNLSIYDRKHFFEATILSADSSKLKQIIYSNIEQTVRKNQYLFDELLKLVSPAHKRFRKSRILRRRYEKVIGVQVYTWKSLLLPS